MAGSKPASEADLKKRRALRGALHATGVTAEAASTVLGGAFRIIGSILLILLISGVLFACIFAYYVKTCLTPELDFSLEDYQLSEASTIW